ncbi:ABC transporter permease subunit [Candidatus Solirubrobacter pratensis]|uniref:ABC transporter permease subunit n=1 Tax=Candidatus Solirubrobacter pratensis TaxID=1298857 RepID=UPI0003F4C4E0|nr:ABC transporter permease [Candidatus Solirubrobacter pratensis]
MSAVTQPRVVLSEWTKLRSLRSSRLSLIVAVGLVIGLGLLIPFVSVSNWAAGTPTAGYNAVERSLGGIYLAQLAFGVLGVMLVTGEYSTGMIRATFTAVPRRLPVLWAKLAVFLAVTLALGTISCVVAFLGGQAIFASKHVDASFGDPHVARAVLGAGLFLAAIGALGVAIGALLRNTAAAIATLTGLLFVLPVIVQVLPRSWSDAIGPYLPGDAGTAIIAMHPDPHQLAPWTGLGVLCVYAAVATMLATVMLVRRDV